MTNQDTEDGIRKLADIVEQSMCIGCGLCEGVAGSDVIRMTMADSGYLLPDVIGTPTQADLDAILTCCPSRQLRALPEAEGTKHDRIWGTYQRLVHAWAAEPEVRFEGATGGVLTALGIHLVESGRVDFILHAIPSKQESTFAQYQLSSSRPDLIAGAGSRYGPTALLVDIKKVLNRGQRFAFVGKPCDISALRNYARIDPRVDELVSFWMTIVCGGFMPPQGTAAFLEQYGIKKDDVTAFRYRGRGFPGPVRIETRDGSVVEKTYYEFWGDKYDRWTLPHRCKICPDSIGEGADIVAADPWPGGGPDLSDDISPGINVVIARTKSGLELLHAATKAGALTLGDEATIWQMNDYQPHQVARKYTSWARFEGLRAEGRVVPDTAGLRIEDLAREMDMAFLEDQTEGTRRRVRDGNAQEPRPAWAPRAIELSERSQDPPAPNAEH